LRLAIASAEFQNAWPTGQPAHNTIHRGAENASHVILPIAPAAEHPLPAPAFAPSPHPIPSADTLSRPDYRIELDLVNDSVACVLRAPTGGRTTNHSRYTVSNRDPANTAIEASATHVAVHGSLDIRVEADCQTVSDSASYTHLSTMRITVNGKPYFHKSWSASVPRRLS
jgi:uncharacterized protein